MYKNDNIECAYAYAEESAVVEAERVKKELLYFIFELQKRIEVLENKMER